MKNKIIGFLIIAIAIYLYWINPYYKNWPGLSRYLLLIGIVLGLSISFSKVRKFLSELIDESPSNEIILKDGLFKQK